MRKVKIPLLVVGVLGALFAAAYLVSAQIEVLDRAAGLLGPGEAAAEGRQEPAGPPPTVSAEARVKADRIRPGMSRLEVDGILGKPAMVRTERAGDGSEVQVGAWMKGNDMISVRFRNGKATTVVASPLGELPSPSGSQAARGGESRRADAEASAPAGEPSCKDLADMLRQVGQQKKRRDEALHKMLDEAGRKD